MEKEADVVVVGGGISGSATAYNLAKRGVKVVLLEKGEVASEGSGRTAAAVRQHGRQPPEIPLMMECIKIWEYLSEELKTDIEFVQGGNMYTAETQEQLTELEDLTRDANEQGLNCRIISAEEARRVVPPLGSPLVGAMYSPRDAHSDPVKTTVAFANAAKEYGAKIYEHCHALGVGVKGGQVDSVITSQGEIKTPVVVNAAGVWANHLAGMLGYHMPVKIIRIFLAETEPLPPTFKTWVRGPFASARQTVRGTIRFGGGYKISVALHDLGIEDFQDVGLWIPRFLKFRYYVRLALERGTLARDIKRISPFVKDKHSLLFPILEPKVDRKGVALREKAFHKMMPSLSKAKVERSWAGLVDFTPDMLPVLGELSRPKGFIMAAGFSGHGYALGPITGKLISELILDSRPSLSLQAFRPSRFAEGKVPIPERLM